MKWIFFLVVFILPDSTQAGEGARDGGMVDCVFFLGVGVGL